ncbi:MAG TPA: hypothetical protein DCQ26_07230 [Marinilabiliales bacterium]|nr:MAG: hypothetical protein A2W96_06235 [Bacteroidetes bacterium GWD2_40_43]OFX94623.1 MAG: hypothetical protein A2W97_18040 [Bacteroidetes bacterium GWE2_40_63]OFY22415.1 MAG: hypothetical protein A2W88_07700 [Bacteroidetes bacterium GWF2_40_13]OFZ24389.1 MAG: hypothetical protein A2437_18170 [Bacteroidetes bacterium RIFOXYC2_FULL_40_12]HAM98388.1 hypothetical protein [Marinilabiliales bacterium]
MKPIFILVVSLVFSSLTAQTDSTKLVRFGAGFRFNDGLYLTHSQLINNNPIPLKYIVSKYNKSDFDFFSKLLADKKVTFFDQFGIKKEIDVDDLWGFCRRGSVYINWGDDFNRIPVMGNICHFVASVTVYEDRYYNPTYGYSTYNMSSNTTPRTEIYQFIMDYQTGKVLEYSVDNILILLMADQELYDEFNALNKKKQKQMKFLYLRKFNEKHPLYVPVN